MNKYYLLMTISIVNSNWHIGVLFKRQKNQNEITYYFWEAPTILNAIKKFNSIQDEITVIPNSLPINDYEIKILALLFSKRNIDAYAQKSQTQMFHHYENDFISRLEEIDAAKNFDSSIYDTYKRSLTIDNR